jgi:hypothetical protein
MSDPGQSNQSGGNKAERILATMKKKVTGGEKEKRKTQTLKVLSKNVVPDILSQYTPTCIKLPNAIMVTMNTEFSAKDKDVDYLDSVGINAFLVDRAQEILADEMKPLASELKILDAMVSTDHIKEKDAVEEFQGKIDKVQQAATAEMGDLLEQAVRAWTSDKSRLKKFRIKSFISIGTSVISIIGNAAHAGLSWGATSPMSVVLIVRSTLSIIQTVGELAAKASQIAALIVLDFKVLNAVITDAQSSDNPKVTKLKNDGVEIGLAALASVTGLKLPSIENCGKRIMVYRTKITEIELKVQQLSAEVQEAIQLNTAVGEAIIVKQSNKLKAVFDDNGKNLSVVLDKIISLNGKIVAGHAQAQEFEGRLKELKDSKHGFTKWASVVFDVAIDAGLGIGAVHQDGEEAAEVMNAIIERTMEAVSAVSKGGIDVASDKI